MEGQRGLVGGLASGAGGSLDLQQTQVVRLADPDPGRERPGRDPRQPGRKQLSFLDDRQDTAGTTVQARPGHLSRPVRVRAGEHRAHCRTRLIGRGKPAGVVCGQLLQHCNLGQTTRAHAAQGLGKVEPTQRKLAQHRQDSIRPRSGLLCVTDTVVQLLGAKAGDHGDQLLDVRCQVEAEHVSNSVRTRQITPDALSSSSSPVDSPSRPPYTSALCWPSAGLGSSAASGLAR